MRVHVDLGSHFTTPATNTVLQVDPDPAYAATSNVTGRYLIPTVDGTSISVTAASYVAPANGASVSSQVFGQLLARFPQYRHVAYNPLLTPADVATLDQTATWNRLIPDPAGGPNPVVWAYPSRFMTGSGTNTMPMGRAVLPVNSTTTPVRPGILITNPIDLSAATSNVGADDFMVYWKVYSFSTTDDVAGVGLGSTVDQNTPALKLAGEVSQETPFVCYISIDDGQNWVQAYRLQQVAFCNKTTKIRLAFINLSTSATFYLAHYAVLF